MKLPEAFETNINKALGKESDAFKESLELPAPVSIRFNPLKSYDSSDLDIKKDVLWSKNAKYLNARPIFTLDPAFHAGGYYVQEASSMYLGHIFENIIDNKKPLRVLDMCAAPGGKTTHLASYLKDTDLLVANEVIKNRVTILKENLGKWGFNNVIICNQDPETFADLEGFFDIVLVDAPCSGEGLFRKDPAAMNEWSEVSVQMCAARQKRILSAAALLVAPQGHLIYSTCTYNSQENDENAQWLTRTLDFEIVNIKNPAAWKITKTVTGNQFYPHKTEGEGFFVSVLKNVGHDQKYSKAKLSLFRVNKAIRESIEPWFKTEEFEEFEFYSKKEGTILALRKSLSDDYGTVFKSIFKRSSGLEIGIFKGKDFIPSHAFALSNLYNADIQSLELPKDEALKYLKKENFQHDSKISGWAIVKYKGLSLGWAKIISDRINNYLPVEFRIRMDLE